MILRLSRRPQALLQTISKPCLFSTPILHRRLEHTMPTLPNSIRESDRLGIPDFLSAKTVEQNWTTYMPYICDQLNTLTAGTPDYDVPALRLVEKYSHSAQHATLFNWASLAVNNHFFFKGLSMQPTAPSATFTKDIAENFDDVANLRQELLETADAMFGNGFVWLMRVHKSGNLRILATYNAGSPFPVAHHRAQAVDMNNTSPGRDVTGAFLTGKLTAGSFGASSTAAYKGHLNALNASPILCLNMWQQMWVPDYGVQGKRTYINQWWNAINWRVVEDEAMMINQQYGFNASAGGMASTLSNSFNSY